MKQPRGWLGLLLLIIPLVTLLTTACAGGFAAQGGWSGPVVSGDLIYVGTREGRLLALDKETGTTAWIFPSPKDEDIGPVYSTPALDDEGWLYVGGFNGNIYAIDTSSIDTSRGLPSVEAEWIFPTNGEIVGGVVVAQGTVLVGSSDGALYALDARDGTLKWRFSTGNKVWSTPAVDGGVVYFGSLDHNLYAVSLAKGEEIWRFETSGAIASTPVVGSGKVYIGSFEGIFYAVNTVTGMEQARFEADSWFWSTPMVLDSRVYVSSLDHKLYALDARTLDLVWIEPLETQGAILGASVVVGDRLVVPSDDGNLYVLRLKDGQDKRLCAIDSEIRAPLATDGDIVYLSALDHSIRAIKIDSRGNPDEIWVRFTNEDEPRRNAAPSC